MTKAASKKTRFQSGEVALINRSAIKLAAYNPRAASPEAARRLRDNIRQVGIIGPALVFNKRTGNLVSGHLRLAQLDVLEDGEDYALEMTVVDWPEKRERQQNVFFNNPWSQGEFDLEALGQLLADDLAELDKFGMDPVEIQHLFPDDERFGDLFADAEPDNTNQPDAKRALDEIEADKDAQKAEAKQKPKPEPRRTPEQMIEQRQEYGKIMDAANASDFYLVVVCKDGAQCSEVLAALGSQETEGRYVSADMVLRALGEAAGA